jgi:hypothetical protein
MYSSSSPIQQVHFSLKESGLELDTFEVLGSAPGGKLHVGFFHKDTVSWSDLEVDLNSKIKHNGFLSQYLIRSIEDTYIGSLLVLNPGCCNVTPYKVTCFNENPTSNFTCTSAGGSGGVLVYNDILGNSVVIAAKTKLNSFLVEVGSKTRRD